MIQEVRKVVRQKQERIHEQAEDDDYDDENSENNDELSAFEIDDEVAQNTESNIRMTRPSFSHQLPPLDNSKQQNRTSAIRFRKGLFATLFMNDAVFPHCF